MNVSAGPGDLGDATVLLIGTGDHPRTSGLRTVPAVGTTLEDLRWALVTRCGVDPENVTVVEPANPSEFASAVAKAVRAAAGPLVFYYVGHGVVNDRGELYLATRETEVEWEHTSQPFAQIRRYLQNSRAPVRLAILDCCYSGRAVDVLAPADQKPSVDIAGWAVLAAAGRDDFAFAPSGARHTAFSGELITLLNEGDPGGPDPITLDSAVEYLRRRLGGGNFPLPEFVRKGRVDELVLAPNAAHTGGPVVPTKLVHAAARRSRGGWVAALAGAVAAGPVVAAIADGALAWTPAGLRGWLPSAPWRWALLVVVAAALAVRLDRGIRTRAATRIARWVTATVPWDRRGVGRWPVARRMTRRLVAPGRYPHFWRRSLSLALPLVLALVFAGGALQAAGAARVTLTGCPPPAQISVLTTPDSYDPVLRLRDAYERAAERDYGCPVARVHVTAAPEQQAAALLRARWTDEARAAVGPSPDVWLPDSSVHVETVRGTAPVAEIRHLATSPIVVATPERGLDTTGATEHLPLTGATLTDLLRGADDVGRRVVVPEPTASVTGELARSPIYAADPGAGPAVEEKLDRARTEARFPAGADVPTLLCHYDETRSTVALLLPEQVAVRFNRGDPIGPACGATRPRFDTRLRLSYPASTAVLDHPFVRLDWPARSPAQLAAAQRFGAWLAAAEGRRALAEIGLRPPGFAGGGALTTDHGALPGAPFSRVEPDDAVRGRILTAYRNAMRAGRVLLMLDGSGSMGTRSAGLRRWDAATRAAVDGTRFMGPDDEVGVSVFQGDDPSGVRRLVDIGPRDTLVGGQRRDAAAAAALNAVAVGGRTPLFAAAVTGATEVGPTDDKRITAVVIVTDGEDDNASRLTAERYTEAVSGQRAQIWVVAIGEASCSARSLRALPASTGGRCVEALPGAVGDVLLGVLRELWRG
ncbi:caspase, EACC1-associated type [Virgisporangium ochraceum]|uniref:VWFA domain-containing protein n=1 Tax=Virgisporangium ochraceum TaxID=65505 RepID=A0A8J4EHZ4_9ACTN|nr:substrate-binding domain-containing protein [Virgisporangium ochraceum]GIJ75238.1 hypothetical protein Voc01_101550 [Virgisporangium ochraceum]